MIATQERWFYDEQGRQVILHGINLVQKEAKARDQSGIVLKDFQNMRCWGLNCVRLGVTWDGIEPQPGAIDEDYLRWLDQRVSWAKTAGLYIILDMHQDLYSSQYSDGAPAWATLTDGQPHLSEGGIWSDAYFSSPAVRVALDHFWQNTPAQDGVGLQDHFAAAWQALAKRYTGEPHVIGYDLFNEPFPGTAALESQSLLFQRGAELLASFETGTGLASQSSGGPSAENLAEMWLNPDGRFAILEILRDPEMYAKIIDSTEPVYARFERDALMGLYRRICKAIRTIDAQGILFLETSMGSNMGVRSAIEPLVGPDGSRDPQQAYAPHGYDLVVDTPNIAASSRERVELIFDRHAETSQRLDLPMLVGEWGAFPIDIPGTLPAAWDVSRLFERYLCGDTYWHYHPDLDQSPPFQAISRPYPERIAGKLLGYGYEPKTGGFSCEWEEDRIMTAHSLVYIPEWLGVKPEQVKLEPNAHGMQIEHSPGGMCLKITPTGQGGQRSLKI